MTRQDLPPTDAAKQPAFADVQTCRNWLAGLPLTNPPHAQALLRQEIGLLERSDLPADERLQILELLREPINFVQNECSRRFVAKPLPLADPEQQAYSANQALWQELEKNYRHCLLACAEAGAAGGAALIAQQALAVAAAALKDSYRAGIVPAAGHWRELHQIYRTAEELGATPQGNGRSVTEIYLEALLIAAAHPFELSPKQFALVTNWAQRWAAKVKILAASPAGAKTPPLMVDLAGEQPAAFGRAGASTPEWRWLELSDLRKSLKKRLLALARGKSPESLQLGKECAQPACEALLGQVYQYWCKGGKGQRVRRGQSGQSGQSAGVRSGTPCHLVGGAEAIHFHLSGQMFRQPGAALTLSKRAHEEIATFGRITSQHDHTQQQVVETWQLLEDNPPGLLLTRPLDQPGLRLCSGQLVAVEQDRAQMLGKVRWVASGQDSLIASVLLLPGKPAAVALRGSGITAHREKFAPGFFLPAVSSLGEAASVVMPKGYFRPGRIIEIYSDHSRQIHLRQLLERGADFERADFTWS